MADSISFFSELDKHTWIRTARNIKFDKDTQTLEVEIQKGDGSWVYNKIVIPSSLTNESLHNLEGNLLFSLTHENSSWIHTARHVKFDRENLVLEAELLNNNNEWVYDRFDIPLESLNEPLHNIDGKFSYNLSS
jgi:hypothetical protein